MRSFSLRVSQSAAASTLLMFSVASHAELSGDTLESVIVTANRSVPTSLPTQIPTTMEGTTREQVAKTINATDSEDAIKYFPSLLVRKRYIGDYNHAVLSSRASGTGNSARSAVYADGILLSNYLGNGATYAPRWMLVTPEEIERVDVMYGPFSAAYPGNSVGAVVDFVTRMPEQREAHAKVLYSVQPFKLYNTDDTFKAHQESVSVGDRFGDLAFWVSFTHLNSHGQPLTFTFKPISTTTALPNDTVVSGAVPGLDRTNTPWLLLGSGTEYTTIQDQAKIKLAYDLSSTLRLNYLLGYWHNDATNRPQSYLRDASGSAVFGNVTTPTQNLFININGYRYTLAPTDFSASNETFAHWMHGLSLKSHSEQTFDYEVAATLFDYAQDQQRASGTALPSALSGGAGTITDQSGTGWYALALKGIWRPEGINGAHIVDFGYQMDRYKLHILRSNTGNWLSDGAGGLNSDVGGKTRTQAVYGQDAWAFAPQWKAVLGLRLEHWQAFGGYVATAARPIPTPYGGRSNNFVSPKAALAYQVNDDLALKASVGRAIRLPTVNELYGATTVDSSNAQFINDPNLRPERSWTMEWTAEQQWQHTSLRATAFYEVVKDSLFSDRRANAAGTGTVTRVVNVGKIVTPGVELSLLSKDLLLSGLDVSGSVTWADSRIKENDGYVISVNSQPVLSDVTLNKYQPRVPEWRATALLNYRISNDLNVAYGARYSGRQYSTLDNSDPNGFAYQGSSRYLTTDVRVRWKFLPQWAAALGIDNLNNYQYWNFHPYPQRTYTAELTWDL